MARFSLWIILCSMVAPWQIVVVCAVVMRNLWIIFLFFCMLAHSMWMHMIQLFGINWVIPGSVANLLCCWHHWLGKYNSDIWNLVLGCLMWTIWTEHNRHSFENIEKSMAQLLDLCQQTLFDWSQCWGLLDCSTIFDFLLSLRIGF